MFLSKLVLDARHPRVRRDLADVYDMHRTLARAFAPDAESHPARFLWRQERSRSVTEAVTLLVQAEGPANWSNVESDSGYLAQSIQVSALDLDRLVGDGQRLRFRLMANPTVTKEGKRLGLRREDEQLAWLGRVADKHGFRVLGCTVAESNRLQARQKDGHRITLDAALFEGIFTVVEKASVQQAIRRGLGRGKAFGLGLLSVAPV